jgi:hypothetical protein
VAWGIQSFEHINQALTCWIQQADETVIGAIGEGTSLEIAANWESPFAESSIGSRYQKTSGALQALSERTTLTTLSSTHVWGGNEPYLYNLSLRFVAFKDPFREVEGAILALQKMIAPELNMAMPGGRVPQPVTILLGRTWVPKNCYVKSLSMGLDKERDQNGNLIRADVEVQVGTIQIINRSDIHY